ncbi:MAG TPA: hypothetical protein VKE69_09785 [Planctomycetota bacterium]|nr:hypothetical protein [Planctomycetota bacterium]
MAAILRTALALAVAAGAGAVAWQAGARVSSAREDEVARDLRALETYKPPAPVRVPHERAKVNDARPDRRAFTPFTATLAIHAPGSKESDARQIVVRSADRIAVELTSAKKEWLFRRNPVEPRHTSAALVDHALEAILAYSNSDLELEGLAAPWETRARLGLAAAEIEALRPTGETREAFGLAFERRVPAGETPDGLREVWWNAENEIPLRIERARNEGAAVFEIVELRLEADAARLKEPVVRFPGYTAQDIGDFRESHHGHER